VTFGDRCVGVFESIPLRCKGHRGRPRPAEIARPILTEVMIGSLPAQRRLDTSPSAAPGRLLRGGARAFAEPDRAPAGSACSYIGRAVDRAATSAKRTLWRRSKSSRTRPHGAFVEHDEETSARRPKWSTCGPRAGTARGEVGVEGRSGGSRPPPPFRGANCGARCGSRSAAAADSDRSASRGLIGARQQPTCATHVAFPLGLFVAVTMSVGIGSRRRHRICTAPPPGTSTAPR